MRSALTVLGISIGVGAFICSVAVGEGAARQIQEQIRSLGENMIWIEAGNRNVNGVRTGTHGTRSLTQADARAIQEQVPLVEHVSPNVDTRTTVVYHNQNWFTQVRGVTREYLPVRHWQVERGGPFSQEDVDYAAKVCLLGQTVVANLFGPDDPVGETIRVQKIPCRVMGVLALKGQSPTGQDQDDVVIMPFTTVQQKVRGIYWLDDIFCSAVSPAAIAAAEDEITALLRERHHLMVDQEDDFNLRHPADIAKASAASQRIMTLLLASIALVALLVGGIGIMNIMLVSVSERTREIGIRMAVGARGADILAQFLVEAITLSLIGGGIGIGLGLIGAYGIAYFVQWQTLIRVAGTRAASDPPSARTWAAVMYVDMGLMAATPVADTAAWTAGGSSAGTCRQRATWAGPWREDSAVGAQSDSPARPAAVVVSRGMTQFPKVVAGIAFFLVLACIGWDANGILGALLAGIVGGVLLHVAMKWKKP